MYGHDAANSRRQPAESTLAPARVATLQPRWSFTTGRPSGAPALDLAELNSTPIEAGGCVYVGAATASAGQPDVYALNADTGELVWQSALDADPAGLGGSIVGAPLVSGDAVIVVVNQQGDGSSQGPYVVALDRRTGHRKWASPPLVTTSGYYTNASPTLGRGVLVIGFSAPEGDPYGHGGVALVDAATGRPLKLAYSVPPADWGTPDAPGYAGGGVWTTPAVDESTGYAYYGSGNPFSKQVAHPRTNAILKLDVDRRRSTFGEVVGSYQGNIDQYSDLIRTASAPTCSLLPDNPWSSLPAPPDRRANDFQALLDNSAGCVQLDLDFGAAPNLFRGRDGGLIVGDLQKSGVYHAIDAATMARAWTSLIGASCQFCNGSSTAYDDSVGALYGDVSPGSLLTSIAAAGGAVRWYSPVGDLVHYQSVSVADGVVYTIDNGGFLDAVDASNGLPILHRSVAADVGADAITLTSAGVAVARHTIYVAAGSHLVAYQPAP
jgi:polyvinyl alcohol dehydrogenase (cytochrome)